MTVGFVFDSFQKKSVIRPIYDYAKGEGYDVEWNQGGASVVSCEWAFHNTLFMPHGVSQENFLSSRNDIKKGPLRMLFPGPFWKEHFANPSPPYLSKQKGSLYIGTAMNYPEERIKVVGWPKSDLIFSSRRKEIEEKWRDKLNLRYDKTVLLTDTFWLKDVLERTEGLEMNFILKPHMYHLSIPFPPFKGSTKNQYLTLSGMKEKLKGSKRIAWVDPQKLSDITELFLISDIIVAYDQGSVATEFMVTGKPVISWPRRDGHIVGGFTVEKDECPVVCCGPDELQKSIVDCLESPNELKRQQAVWLEKMIYKPDGNASKRAWEAIMELVKG